MSIALETKCTLADSCKFGDTCLINKSFHEGGTFDPSLKIRLIRTKKQVRCFSYTEENGGNNGRQK